MNREQFVALCFILISSLFMVAFGLDLFGVPISAPVKDVIKYFSLMISMMFMIININLWVHKEDISPPNCVFLAISAATFCWSVGWLS